MIIRLRMRYIIAFIILSSICLCSVYERYLDEGFLDKNTEIARGVAKGINDIDISLDNLTGNTVLLVKEYIAAHPKMTKNDLIKIKEQTHNPTITIYDKNGYFYLTTSRAMDPTYEYYDHYKNLSVLNGQSSSKAISTINTCKKAHKEPNNLIIMPLYSRDKPRRNVTKNAILYDKNTDYIFDVSYHGDDIQKILDKNFNFYKNIVYLAVSDQHGNIIIDRGQDYSNTANEVVNKYGENIIIKKDSRFLASRLPFGGEKNVTGISTNGSNVYFYVLTAVFDKKDVNNQIFIIRITFAVITLVILLILYCVGLKQRGVVDLRATGKKKKDSIKKEAQ